MFDPVWDPDGLNYSEWGGASLEITSRLRKNKKDVIASDRRERSNLVFASETPDCFVASLLAMTKSDFFRTLLDRIYRIDRIFFNFLIRVVRNLSV
jgi:hypothetical protein